MIEEVKVKKLNPIPDGGEDFEKIDKMKLFSKQEAISLAHWYCI